MMRCRNIGMRLAKCVRPGCNNVVAIRAGGVAKMCGKCRKEFEERMKATMKLNASNKLYGGGR